jgi:hypothetical protein
MSFSTLTNSSRMPVLLLPECYADNALIKLLAPAEAEVEHISGVFNIVKALKNTALTQPDYTVIGIIDKDVTYKPGRQPPYFDDFILDETVNKLTYGHKPNSSQYLIMLDKAIETFILWNAAQVAIQVTDYGFPENLRKFCKVLKSTTIETDPNYLRLLTDLRTRQAPGLITLQRILHDFATN